METKQILNASLLDIVFDGRNKAYGAYDLRNTYDKRLSVALLTTAGIIALFFGLFFLFKNKQDTVTKITHVIEVNPTNYLPPETKTVKPPPPPPAAAKELPKIKITKFVVPKVVNDKDVKPNERPLTQNELMHVNIGSINQSGKDNTNVLAVKPEMRGVGGSGNISLNNNRPVNGEISTVQVEASFPGGQDAWQRYLKTNLRETVPIDNGAPAGSYKVVVSFLVSRDGSISEVKAISAPTPDYGTAAEAVRVIERGPKWNPAIQNGRQVTYRQKQGIIFTVQGD